MPTKDRVEAVVIEISEKIESLGYDVAEIIGPIEQENEGDETEESVYYITAQGGNIRFYITFSDEYKFGNVVYPFNIAAHLARQLDWDETEAVVEEQPNWDDISEDEMNELQKQAGRRIIENTAIEDLLVAKFNLSAYASTAIVDYRQSLAENDFPVQFQCSRAVFPYTEHISLRKLDDRIVPVLIAGERGRRYVESSFLVEKEGQPDEYTLIAQF